MNTNLIATAEHRCPATPPMEAGPSQELIDQAAAVGYAAVRELGVTTGEFDRATWQIAPADEKGCFRRAARRVLEGETDAAVIHNAWVEQRTAEGWRFAQNFDLARRENPLLLPYTHLTGLRQFHYTLFINTVRSFAGKQGRLRS